MSFARMVRLMETMRSVAQTGYALSDIAKHEQSDLAQHQYVVATIAWQLARTAIRAGGKLDLGRVLECALIHDAPEVLGGDIAMPYARANPAARAAAKEFERHNMEYMATFFDDDEEYVLALGREVLGLTKQSDEVLVAKLGDYIEHTHYKLSIQRLTPNDVAMAQAALHLKLDKIEDSITQSTLRGVIDAWADEMRQPQADLFEQAKLIEVLNESAVTAQQSH